MKRALFLVLLMSLGLPAFSEVPSIIGALQVSRPAQPNQATRPQAPNEPTDYGWFTKDPNGKIAFKGKMPLGMKKVKGLVTLGDGRICKNCTVILKQGTPYALIDSDGYEWEAAAGTSLYIDKHPYMRAYAQSMQQAASVYSVQQAQAAQQARQNAQMYRKPTTTNCSTNPVGFGTYNTQCNSY